MTRNPFYQDLDHEWLRGLRFTDTTADELFARFAKSEHKSSTKPTAWVFDLDSTLFSVGPRVRAIFVEFLRSHPKPLPIWHKVLSFMNSSRQPYNIELGIRQIIQEWDSQNAAALAAELWNEFRPFWTTHFFSDRFLQYDEAYPGACDFVKKVLHEGHQIVYLTGRDRPRCGMGTFQSLRVAGFPMTHDTHLLMKSDPLESDLAYKQKTAALLHSRFKPLLFIDNEPENIVMFAREFPDAQIVFFHTVMSERVPTADFQKLLGQREALRLSSF